MWCCREKGNGDGEGELEVEKKWRGGKRKWVLVDVYTRRLSGLEEKLICSYKFVV